MIGVPLRGYEIKAILKRINKSFWQDESFCRSAVSADCRTLLYVPGKFKNIEICLAAIKESKSAINLVPDVLKDKILQLLDDQEE